MKDLSAAPVSWQCNQHPAVGVPSGDLIDGAGLLCQHSEQSLVAIALFIMVHAAEEIESSFMVPFRSLSIIDAPTNLGLAPLQEGHQPGTRKGPDALRELGLHRLLSPESQYRIEAQPYADAARVSNIRNANAIRKYSVVLADTIEQEMRRKSFPLVVGGDCSILLGAGLATSRLGGRGLVFLDGHTDFYLPEQSTTGGVRGDGSCTSDWLGT